MTFRKGDRIQFTLGRGCLSPELTGEVVEDVTEGSPIAHVQWDHDSEPTFEFLVFLEKSSVQPLR